MKDYAKCVFANKATFWSYTIMILAVIPVIVSGIFFVGSYDLAFSIFFIPFFAAFALNSYTLFAWGTTLDAYRRTKQHIERFGRIGEGFALSIERAYCYRVGFELAAREAGFPTSLEAAQLRAVQES